MNVPSNILEADLGRLTARLTTLERRVDSLTPSNDAPAPLPVDKKPAAHYCLDASESAEADSDEEEVPVNPMSSLTHHQIREVVAAFDDYLSWKEFPNPTMNADMREFIEINAFRRLQEAMLPLEGVVKALE